ncbi:MAG: matrixin family metalloprotease [Polyangiaceae bacterium]
MRQKPGWALALGVAAAGLVTLSTGTASAYCRTSSCNGEVAAVCTPAQPTDCGVPLFWPTRCVSFAVQTDASSDVNAATTQDVAAQAFATWAAAECPGGGNPNISAEDFGLVNCDQVEYDGESKNANIIMYRDTAWPYDASALALTTVTFATESGEIRDADIELNSERADFTTSDANVDTDLLSILTHETGHFLGLAHSPDDSATMFADYPPKSTTLRSLEADDIAAICEAYPPTSSRECDPEPRNGFATECGVPADEGGGGCGCAIPSSGAQRSWSLAALGLVAWFGRAARARRSDRRRR